MTFFWGRNDAFSNWKPSRFTVGDQVFSSGEQWLMYAKATLFKDAMTARRILDQHDPRALKALGQTVRNFVQSVWDENCEEVAFTGLVEKFRQNKDHGALLVSTEGTVLVEASPYDRIWGIGMAASDPRAIHPSQWIGMNRLGKVLTRARADVAERMRQVLARASTPPVPPFVPTLPPPTTVVAQPRFFTQATNRSATMTTPTHSFASLAALSRNRGAVPAMEQPAAASATSPVVAAVTPTAIDPEAAKFAPVPIAVIAGAFDAGSAGLDFDRIANPVVPASALEVATAELAALPADVSIDEWLDKEAAVLVATDAAATEHALETPAANELGAGFQLTSEPLRSIAVVVGHSDRRIAQILTGVVGEIHESKFTVDPAYGELSYLFTLATEGEIDVESAHFQSVPMLEQDVPAFRANLIRGSRAAWEALYDSVGSGVAATDIASRMLAAERARVSTNVDRYLARQNLINFDVPVIAHATVGQADAMEPHNPAFRATEADLIKEGHVRAEGMQINAAGEVLPTPVEPAASAALSAELRGHSGGFELKIESAVPVLASDPEQALRVMMNIMAVVNRNIPMMRNVLTFGASSIQNADLVPYEAPDDDYSDDWRDRGG